MGSTLLGHVMPDRKILNLGWARGSAGGAGWLSAGGWGLVQAVWVRVTV